MARDIPASDTSKFSALLQTLLTFLFPIPFPHLGHQDVCRRIFSSKDILKLMNKAHYVHITNLWSAPPPHGGRSWESSSHALRRLGCHGFVGTAYIHSSLISWLLNWAGTGFWNCILAVNVSNWSVKTEGNTFLPFYNMIKIFKVVAQECEMHICLFVNMLLMNETQLSLFFVDTFYVWVFNMQHYNIVT